MKAVVYVSYLQAVVLTGGFVLEKEAAECLGGMVLVKVFSSATLAFFLPGATGLNTTNYVMIPHFLFSRASPPLPIYITIYIYCGQIYRHFAHPRIFSSFFLYLS